MVSQVGEFKGHPTITLMERPGARGFTFGIRKAILILQHMEDIQNFVEGYGRY